MGQAHGLESAGTDYSNILTERSGCLECLEAFLQRFGTPEIVRVEETAEGLDFSALQSSQVGPAQDQVAGESGG